MSPHDPQDDLLRRLAEQARAEGEADEQDALWQRYSSGTADAQDLARIRRLCEENPEARRLEEAFRPLDETFHKRLAEGAARRLASAVETKPKARPGRASVLRPLWAWAAAFILVAGLALVWKIGDRSPAFSSLEVSTSQDRASTPSPPQQPPVVLQPGSDIFLTLEAPSQEVPRHRLSLFLRTADGVLRPLDIEHEVRSAGQVALRARWHSTPTHPAPPDTEASVKGPTQAPEPGPAELIVASHRSREISAGQVSGGVKGSLLDWLWGPGQRLVRPVIVETDQVRLKVEFHGCAEVISNGDGAECVLSSQRPLRLWLDADSPESLEIRLGDRRWTMGDARPVAEGYLLLLEEPGSGSLHVRAGATEWRLRLSKPRVPAPAVTEGQEAATGAFKQQDFGQAAELYLELARIQGDRGALSAEIDALTVAYHLYAEVLGQLGTAKQVLEHLPEPADGDGRSLYLSAFYRGLWALESGDLGRALFLLGQATQHAERGQLDREALLAEQLVARVLRRLGRGDEAEQLFLRFRRKVDELDACDRVAWLNNRAWDLLLELESGRRPSGFTPEIVELLESGLDWLGQCKSLPPDEPLNLRLNLALAAFHAGQLEKSNRHLAAVESAAGPLKMRLRLWQLDLRSRLELASGRPEQAVVLSQRLARLADHSRRPEAGRRAAVAEARARLAQSDDDGAEDAFAAAEDRLDEECRRIPLDLDRGSVLAALNPSTMEYIDLLLRRGQVRKAFDAARWARARIYRSAVLGAAPAWLDEAALESWLSTVRRYQGEAASVQAMESDPSRRARRFKELESLAGEAVEPMDRRLAEWGLAGELAPLDAAETVLLYHPLPAGEWVGFAAHGGRVDAHRFEAGEADLASRLWLRPFTGLLSRSSLVRVLPLGALAEVDFHALPSGGEPLSAQVPVIYGLDLAPVADASAQRPALLVASPDGDLPSTATEVAAVRRALGERGVLPLPLATAPEILRGLGSAGLFHFAGHGDVAGRDGLESYLELALGTRLTAKDLLAAPVRMPSVVVLSACRSAATAPTSTSPGLGLAHAFLLRGSALVIGAVRAVDDRSTERFVRLLYGVWDGSPEGAPEALRHAQMEMRRVDPEGWASYRLLAR